jgi:hypothetical protein
MPRKQKVPLEERFWSHVAKGSGCWIWTGFWNCNGYGSIGVGNKKVVAAHRVAYELQVGPIPPGLWVLHKCDNPPCVRGDHLYAGTAQQNHDDMIARGRNVTVSQRGEANGRAMLSAAEIVEIRNLFAGGATPKELEDKFVVSSQYIGKIVTGKAWKHLGEPVCPVEERPPSLPRLMQI